MLHKRVLYNVNSAVCKYLCTRILGLYHYTTNANTKKKKTIIFNIFFDFSGGEKTPVHYLFSLLQAEFNITILAKKLFLCSLSLSVCLFFILFFVRYDYFYHLISVWPKISRFDIFFVCLFAEPLKYYILYIIETVGFFKMIFFPMKA